MHFSTARLLRLSTLIAIAGVLAWSAATAFGGQLLYVTMGSGTSSRVLTYDVSLASAAAVQGSAQTFTSGTTTNFPSGIALSYSGQNIYVGNFQGSPTNISAFTTSGTYVGRYGSGNGYMNMPAGIGTDQAGRIWYQNSGVPEIGELNSSGALLGNITVDDQSYYGLAVLSTGTHIQQQMLFTASYNGNKVVKYRGDGILQQTISTNLSNPMGVALDSSNNLYVTNYLNNTISKFDSSGTFLTSIGSSANLNQPAFLSIDSTGNIYVPNAGNSTISKFDSSGNFQFQWSTPVGPFGTALGISQPVGPSSLIWNTTDGTWNTSNTVWTTGTGGTLAFTNGDSVTFSGTGGGVVTLSGSMQPSSITVSATSGTYTFVSSAGNLLTGTTGLSKSGGGTLVLSGSNAFTGTTLITGGSLLVNGVLSSTTTTVSGGLLGGSGTVSGAVQMAAGGTIAPGAAGGGTGILTLNGLSGTSFAIAMDISGTAPGTGHDTISTTTLDYTGATLQLSLSGSYADGTTFDLFDFTTQSGTLADIAPLTASLPAYNGLTWGLATTSTNFFDQQYGPGVWLSNWGSNGQRFIFNQADGVLTVVPEPSTFALAGAGLAGCALLRWRRARRRSRDAAGNAARLA